MSSLQPKPVFKNVSIEETDRFIDEQLKLALAKVPERWTKFEKKQKELKKNTQSKKIEASEINPIIFDRVD